MKIIKEVFFTLIISLILTVPLVAYFRPSIVSFTATSVLQVMSFTALIMFYYLLLISGVRRVISYLLSFMASYLLLLFVLLQINGIPLKDFFQGYYHSFDFWILDFPFLTTNIVALILIARKAKSIPKTI